MTQRKKESGTINQSRPSGIAAPKELTNKESPKKESTEKKSTKPDGQPAQTSSEAGLFREAMADAQPLDFNLAELSGPKPRPLPLEQPQEPSSLKDFADIQVETHELLEFRRPGIQLRVFHDLVRGRIIPEASLDLHGYRVEEARKALPRFLDLAQHRALRCVRLIHGKGKGSAGQQPILKQKVNQWLPQSPAVLAFCSAPRWDGGSGATYVLLARKATEMAEN